jgi:hypothetical protein
MIGRGGGDGRCTSSETRQPVFWGGGPIKGGGGVQCTHEGGGYRVC